MTEEKTAMGIRSCCALSMWVFDPIGDFRKTGGKLSSQRSQKIVWKTTLVKKGQAFPAPWIFQVHTGPPIAKFLLH